MKVLKLSREKFEEIIKTAVSILKAGGVVVVPTDTIYGLAADFFNNEAREKIFKIKNRPFDKLLPVFVSSIEEARKIVKIDQKIEKFLEKVWPGKVTVVFKREEGGLRVPQNDFILELLKKFGRPLSETSVNISGDPALTKIQGIVKIFSTTEYQPDLIIDAGDLPDSPPSTVIDVTVDPPQILRPGAVSKEEIMRYIEGL